MERSRRAIVIPALNEEKTISQVVNAVKSYGTVIVVNDGSKDQTAALATAANAVVCTHEKNKGYEAAIETGFKKALEMGLELALTFDADGQHDPSIVDRFFTPLENNIADLVIGIRPTKARFSETIMAVYFKMKFNIEDPLCGMKAYRLKYFSSHGTFDTINSIGTELAIYSLKNGARLAQQPIKTYRRQDKPRFGGVIIANYKILRALFRIMRFANSDSGYSEQQT